MKSLIIASAAAVAVAAGAITAAAHEPDTASVQAASVSYESERIGVPLDAASPDPTPAPAVKPKPKPKPKVVVVKKKTVTTKKKTATTTRSFSGDRRWNAPELQAIWAKYPAWVQKFGLCVAHHESWNVGLWTAEYHGPVSSTASGFAQWLNSIWQLHAQRAGVGTQYRRAMYAPPAIQVEVFANQVYRFGKYPWKGTHCGYGT